MSYPIPRSEADIIQMQSDGDVEGPHLEYKSARLFDSRNEKVFETLSKEITAFANSAGGVLIIGVEENDDRSIQKISPVVDPQKTDSWIENGLLPRISPPISLKINTVEVCGGKVFVIDVPASHNAPHQSSDKRYYARRLFRVDPLLAFEIDDIRRRTFENPLSVSMSLSFSDELINFIVKNDGNVPVYDISIDIDGIDNREIANDWTPPLQRPYLEPFKVLHPGSEYYFLGSGYEFFQKKLSDTFIVKVLFSDADGGNHSKSYTHYLKDFESTQKRMPNSEKLLKSIEKQLKGIGKPLEDLVHVIKAANESVVHSSGLNLSNTTLTALSKNREWKWSGRDMSIMGLAEVLEIDTDTALKIHRQLFGGFNYVGQKDVDLSEIDIDDEIKAKIRERLIIPPEK